MRSIPSARSFGTKTPESEVIILKTTKSSGTFGALSSILVYWASPSRSGSLKVEWWDGTTTTYAGIAYNHMGDNNLVKQAAISKAIVAPYDTSAEKIVKIYPVNANGEKSGEIRGLNASTTGNTSWVFTDVIFSGCLNIRELSVSDNGISTLSSWPSLPPLIQNHTQLTYFLVTNIGGIGSSLSFNRCQHLESITIQNCSSLTSISVNNLTTISPARYYASLNIYNCTSLTSVSFKNSSLIGLSISLCAALTSLDLENSDLSFIAFNTLTSLTSISNFLSTSANLSFISITNTGFTSFTVPATSNVVGSITISNNSSMTSIRMVGQNPVTYKYFSSYSFNAGIFISNNNLNAAALNQVYTDLAGVPQPSYIQVAGNPGTGTDNPAIATAKGWVVLGT
jgi:hypothetical protein